MQKEGSDGANLQASESELGSEDDRDLSENGRKEQQGGKNRRTIRRSATVSSGSAHSQHKICQLFLA